MSKFQPFFVFIETQEEAQHLKSLIKVLVCGRGHLGRFYRELVEKMDSNCSERNVTQSGSAHAA